MPENMAIGPQSFSATISPGTGIYLMFAIMSTWDYILLCCGGSPVLCRVFSSIPRLTHYEMAIASPSSPSCEKLWQSNCLKSLQRIKLPVSQRNWITCSVYPPQCWGRALISWLVTQTWMNKLWQVCTHKMTPWQACGWRRVSRRRELSLDHCYMAFPKPFNSALSNTVGTSPIWLSLKMQLLQLKNCIFISLRLSYI